MLEDRTGTRQAQITGPDGTFTFEGLSVDSYTLTVRYIGYTTFEGAVAVSAGLPANLTIMLTRDPISVDPLGVTVEGRARLLRDVGFYDRMADGWGQFFEPEWIEANRSGYIRLEQFVQRLAGHRPPSACSLVPTYLDRRRINYPTESKYAMHELSAWEIGAAEVYPPTTPLPLFALNDTTQVCGAIILWSTWTTPMRNMIPKIKVKLCEPSGRAGQATLEGIVEDDLTEVRLPAARVRASYPVSDTGGLREIEVRADSVGRYRVCDVPIGASVTLVASYGPHVGVRVVAEAVSGVWTKLTVTVTA